MIDDLSHSNLPAGKCWSVGIGAKRGVVSSCERPCEQRVRRRHALRQICSIETDKGEGSRQEALGDAQASGPNSNIVILPADEFGCLGQGDEISSDCLHDLLNDDISKALPARDMVTAGDLLGRV